jgi:hypothetical protein
VVYTNVIYQVIKATEFKYSIFMEDGEWEGKNSITVNYQTLDLCSVKKKCIHCHLSKKDMTVSAAV